MLKITFLGTAGSTPTPTRNLPSISIEYDGSMFLFDCGEGTQRQMMLYNLNIFKLKAIFLTHLHGDHSIGVAGLVRTLALMRRTTPLYIYAPKGDERALKPLLEFDRALIGYEIKILPLKSGVTYKDKSFTISAFKVKHTIDTYGLVFKENDKIHFLKEKIRNSGLKGQMFQELLKKRKITVRNRTIKLKDVTQVNYGKKVTYATDTRPLKSIIDAARNSNLLIYEATYASSEKHLAKERFHSTAEEAATLARASKSRNLILTHVSARYKNPNMLLKEARRIFKNTEIARDGMTVNV